MATAVSKPDIAKLEHIARMIRLDIIQMIGVGQRGHLGGSCSIADVVTVLYFSKMRHDPLNPSWPDRDRFLLSKGHAALVQYAALAECGYFSKEELKNAKREPVADTELRRSKDHLKGSLMLGLENTASRMSHLARQEIYFDRQFSLDETLEGIEKVTADDVHRVACELFADGSLAATVLGPADGLQVPAERFNLD